MMFQFIVGYVYIANGNKNGLRLTETSPLYTELVGDLCYKRRISETNDERIAWLKKRFQGFEKKAVELLKYHCKSATLKIDILPFWSLCGRTFQSFTISRFWMPPKMNNGWSIHKGLHPETMHSCKEQITYRKSSRKGATTVSKTLDSMDPATKSKGRQTGA